MREVGTTARKVMTVAAVLLGAGCAGTLTPEQKMSHEIFVETAHQCESRYRTLHVDQVDLEGGLKLHADADSRSEYRYFIACYHDGLKTRAEGRRKAGLPVPDGLMRAPDVELD